MWDLDDLSFSPNSFSGQARLFPLPNLVMFPNVMQPLHIFEPRYVQMIEDAMTGDRLIATCLLLPGWERDYEGCPDIASVACLGKIVSCQKQDDGTYNILLLGLRRVRIQEEVPAVGLYRRAYVEMMADVYPDAAPPALELSFSEPELADESQAMQEQLLAAFKNMLPKLTIESSEPLEELIASQMTLGMLTDIISYTLDMSLKVKQKMLAEMRVVRRAETLLKHLALQNYEAELAGIERHAFPPKFSLN